MPEYNLHEYQRQLVRELVRIVNETSIADFSYRISSTAGIRATFETRDGPKGVVQFRTPGDLTAIADEGLVSLTMSRRDPSVIIGGMVKKAAVDAVAANFQLPSSVSPTGTIQNFYAPVGAVSTGTGEIRVTQNVGMAAADVLATIDAMRTLAADLAEGRREEAIELLNEIEIEVRSDVPKQSRLKSFLLGLCGVVGDVAGFASSLTSIAQAYGISPETLRRITPGI